MIVAYVIVTSLIVLGIIVVLVTAARAPRGYQDDYGYHTGADPPEQVTATDQRG